MADLELSGVDSISVTPEKGYLTISIEGAQTSELLEAIDLDEAIRYYGYDYFLDAIGEDDARKHFGWGEEDDEDN